MYVFLFHSSLPSSVPIPNLVWFNNSLFFHIFIIFYIFCSAVLCTNQIYSVLFLSVRLCSTLSSFILVCSALLHMIFLFHFILSTQFCSTVCSSRSICLSPSVIFSVPFCSITCCSIIWRRISCVLLKKQSTVWKRAQHGPTRALAARSFFARRGSSHSFVVWTTKIWVKENNKQAMTTSGENPGGMSISCREWCNTFEFVLKIRIVQVFRCGSTCDFFSSLAMCIKPVVPFCGQWESSKLFTFVQNEQTQTHTQRARATHQHHTETQHNTTQHNSTTAHHTTPHHTTPHHTTPHHTTPHHTTPHHLLAQTRAHTHDHNTMTNEDQGSVFFCNKHEMCTVMKIKYPFLFLFHVKTFVFLMKWQWNKLLSFASTWDFCCHCEIIAPCCLRNSTVWPCFSAQVKHR